MLLNTLNGHSVFISVTVKRIDPFILIHFNSLVYINDKDLQRITTAEGEIANYEDIMYEDEEIDKKTPPKTSTQPKRLKSLGISVQIRKKGNMEEECGINEVRLPKCKSTFAFIETLSVVPEFTSKLRKYH